MNYLTIIPRARVGSESIAPAAEGSTNQNAALIIDH